MQILPHYIVLGSVPKTLYGEGAPRSQTDRLLEGDDLWAGGPVRAKVGPLITYPWLPLGVLL